MMKRTAEAFLDLKMPAFYNSLATEAREERWAKRKAKITARKNRINLKTIKKIVAENTRQPSLFD